MESCRIPDLKLSHKDVCLCSFKKTSSTFTRLPNIRICIDLKIFYRILLKVVRGGGGGVKGGGQNPPPSECLVPFFESSVPYFAHFSILKPLHFKKYFTILQSYFLTSYDNNLKIYTILILVTCNLQT